MAKKYFFFGLIFGSDPHTRITRSDNFELRGGSQPAHERLTELAIKVDEKLSKRDQVTPQVFAEAVQETQAKLDS